MLSQITEIIIITEVFFNILNSNQINEIILVEFSEINHQHHLGT